MVWYVLGAPEVYLLAVKREFRSVAFPDNYFLVDEVVYFALGKLTGRRSLTLTPLV